MLRCPKCGNSKIVKGGTANHGNGPDGAQRYKCGDQKKCKWHGTQPVGLDTHTTRDLDSDKIQAVHEKIRTAKRLVITSAQNATPVYRPFFNSLLAYCKANDAQLVVIPYRYKNPTSHWSSKAEGDDWWAPELHDYLYNRRIEVNEHLMILGDIMTQPTATSPLSGFESISGRMSAIIGHPKLELTCVPTPQARLPKILTTTGSVTKRNYIQAKAGKKGEFHHTFGAAVVELKGKKFYLRQLNALKNGSFMDLDCKYRADQIERGIRLEALSMGDTHEEFVSPDVVKATFGEGGIVPTLKPKRLIWHDLHDFYSRNHHHRGRVFTNIAKMEAGMDSVRAGLEKTFRFLDKHTPPGTQSIVVDSNHPAALKRWIEESDWRADPVNSEFYLETALAMRRATKMTETGAVTVDPFRFWGEQWLKSRDRVRFLGPDESFTVKGIECTYHGDKGPNGARGNIRAFGKIGVKTIIGHGHAPGIREGVYQNGTSTPLKLEYTSGPSSWLNAHTAVYRNGKRTLLIVIDGEWRA